MKVKITTLLAIALTNFGSSFAASEPIQARFGVEPELRIGATIKSQNGSYVLIVQSDGNAVIYKSTCIGNPECSTFSTGTNKRTSNPIFRVQADGNLVLYDGTSMKPLWMSGARGFADYRLTLSDQGYLKQEKVVYKARWSYVTGRVKPRNAPAQVCAPGQPEFCHLLRASGSSIRSRIGSEAQLVPGQELLSLDKSFRLVVQSDGNAVVYATACTTPTDCVPFHTGTNEKTTSPILRMQADGNLVLYDAAEAGVLKALFNIGVSGDGEYVLALQNDGNLVVYQAVVDATRIVKNPPPPAPPAPQPTRPNPNPGVEIPFATCITASTTSIAPNNITIQNRCTYPVRVDFADFCNGNALFGSVSATIPALGLGSVPVSRSDCSVLGGNTFRREIVRAWKLE